MQPIVMIADTAITPAILSVAMPAVIFKPPTFKSFLSYQGPVATASPSQFVFASGTVKHLVLLLHFVVSIELGRGLPSITVTSLLFL